MHNERVKLTADLMEAAQKHGCVIPPQAIIEILNDKNNMEALGTTSYTDVSQPISEAKKLIAERQKKIDDLY